MSTASLLGVQVPDPRRLPACVAGLLGVYAFYCNRRRGFVGHLFQGRFQSPIVQREGYWLSCGRYIERNPVEASMVGQAWDYLGGKVTVSSSAGFGIICSQWLFRRRRSKLGPQQPRTRDTRG